MLSAMRFHSSNSAGSTYLSTFMCRLVGRMYWPKVTTSTSALRSSVHSVSEE